MSNKFTITIEIGNDAMQTPQDVGAALEYIVMRLKRGATDGVIKDVNGNTVGHFEGDFPEDED